MCKDLETQAQDYAEKAILRLRETLIATEDTIFSVIAEAYNQGYRDATTPHRSNNIDASPAMIEIAIGNLHQRGEIELREDLSCNEKLSNMKNLMQELKD